MDPTSNLRPSTEWTTERMDDLRRLWSEGVSASGIERAFGCVFSRSAVLGKVHRLGLEKRRQAYSQPRERKPHAPVVKVGHGFDFRLARTEKAAKQRKSSGPVPPTPILEIAPLPECRPCSLLELTADRCHFPIGDPGQPDFHFCGAQPETGPYCGFHHEVTHRSAA